MFTLKACSLFFFHECKCFCLALRLLFVCVCVRARNHDGGRWLVKTHSSNASGHYCLSGQTSLLVCPENTTPLPRPLSPRAAPMGPLV